MTIDELKIAISDMADDAMMYVPLALITKIDSSRTEWAKKLIQNGDSTTQMKIRDIRALLE